MTTFPTRQQEIDAQRQARYEADLAKAQEAAAVFEIEVPDLKLRVMAGALIVVHGIIQRAHNLDDALVGLGTMTRDLEKTIRMNFK